MDGWDYEKECAEYLATLGFTDIQVTPGSGDFGCDILAFKDGKKYGIQCKYYDEGKIGVKAVQEAVAGSIFYDCDVPMVITNVSFTDNAIAYAKKCRAELMPDLDAVQIITALKNKSQSQKEEAPVLLRNIDDFVYVLKAYRDKNIDDFVYVLKAYRDKKKIAEAEKLQKDLQEDLLEDICQCLLESQYEQACNRIKNELAKKDKILSDDYLETLYKMTEKRWQVMCTLSNYMEKWSIDTIQEKFSENGFGCITLPELEDMVNEGLLESVVVQGSSLFYKKGTYQLQENNISIFENTIEQIIQDAQERAEKERSVFASEKSHEVETCENARKSLVSRIMKKKEEIDHCFVFSFSRKKTLTEQLAGLENELSNQPSIEDIAQRYDTDILKFEESLFDDVIKQENHLIQQYGILDWYYESHQHIQKDEIFDVQQINISTFEEAVEELILNAKERIKKERSNLLQKKNHDINACNNKKNTLESRIFEKKKELSCSSDLSSDSRNDLLEQLSSLENELTDLPSIEDIELQYDSEVLRLEDQVFDDVVKQEDDLIQQYGILDGYYDSHQHIHKDEIV